MNNRRLILHLCLAAMAWASSLVGSPAASSSAAAAPLPASYEQSHYDRRIAVIAPTSDRVAGQADFSLAAGLDQDRFAMSATDVIDSDNVVAAVAAESTTGLSMSGIEAIQDYVYSGHRWPGDAPIVDFYVNVNPGPGVLVEVPTAKIREAILGAAQTWNAVEGASIYLRYVGETSAVQSGLNGRNEIFFGRLDSGQTLARSYSWFRTSTGELVEVDLAINMLPDYGVGEGLDSREIDLQSVVLHELGHWVSLDHDEEVQAVMHPNLARGMLKRALHANDVRGISAVYPCSAPPCAPEDNGEEGLPEAEEQILIEPDRTTVHLFAGQADSKNMRLIVPAGAAKEPTTLVYASISAQNSSANPARYRYAQYGFSLNAITPDGEIDDFKFELPATYEVRYGDIDALSIDERTLRLFVRQDSSWRPAVCSGYRHAPDANQFSATGCELGGLAVFGQLDVDSPSASTSTSIYIPMVQTR